MNSAYAQDLAQIAPETPVAASGFVTALRKYEGWTFLRVVDLTGEFKVRLVGLAGDVKKSRRIRVEGTLRFNDEGAYILADTPPVVLGGPLSADSRSTGEPGEWLSRALTARLRAGAAAYLNRQGFLEIEPRLLSTIWPSVGLEPIRAAYPGFGASVTLATSPLPQLLEFVEATGVARVYCATHSFATSFRDRFSSTEVAILGARALDLEADEIDAFLMQLASSALLTAERMGDEPGEKTSSSPTSVDLAQTSVVWTDDFAGAESSSPKRTLNSVAQLRAKDGRLLVEAAVESLEGAKPLVSIVVYLEQMLPLVRRASVQSLRNLSSVRSWFEAST